MKRSKRRQRGSRKSAKKRNKQRKTRKFSSKGRKPSRRKHRKKGTAWRGSRKNTSRQSVPKTRKPKSYWKGATTKRFKPKPKPPRKPRYRKVKSRKRGAGKIRKARVVKRFGEYEVKRDPVTEEEWVRAFADKLEAVETSITEEFGDALGTSIYSHINSDGSVDSQVVVTGIDESGLDSDDVAKYAAYGLLGKLPGAWISVGARFDFEKFDPDLHKTDFERYDGLLREFFNWSHYTQHPDRMEKLRSFFRALEDKAYFVHEIIIRLHWNAWKIQPGK